jgi:hypothetical protein
MNTWSKWYINVLEVTIVRKRLDKDAKQLDYRGGEEVDGAEIGSEEIWTHYRNFGQSWMHWMWVSTHTTGPDQNYARQRGLNAPRLSRVGGSLPA